MQQKRDNFDAVLRVLANHAAQIQNPGQRYRQQTSIEPHLALTGNRRRIRNMQRNIDKWKRKSRNVLKTSTNVNKLIDALKNGADATAISARDAQRLFRMLWNVYGGEKHKRVTEMAVLLLRAGAPVSRSWFTKYAPNVMYPILYDYVSSGAPIFLEAVEELRKHGMRRKLIRGVFYDTMQSVDLDTTGARWQRFMTLARLSLAGERQAPLPAKESVWTYLGNSDAPSETCVADLVQIGGRLDSKALDTYIRRVSPVTNNANFWSNDIIPLNEDILTMFQRAGVRTNLKPHAIQNLYARASIARHGLFPVPKPPAGMPGYKRRRT